MTDALSSETSNQDEFSVTEAINDNSELPGEAILVSNITPQSNNLESDSAYTVDVPNRTKFLVLTAIWENQSEQAEIQLIDPNGNVISESDFERLGIQLAFDSDEMREYNSSSLISKSAHIRNPLSGSWQIEVVDPMNLGEISFQKRDGIVGRIAPEMTILPGIEQIDESQFKFNYEVEDPDSDDIRMDIYADINQEGYNGLDIGQSIASVPVSKGQGSYILGTEGFAPGEYYLYTTVTDDYSERSSYVEPFSNYSTEKITVVREADISANIIADTNEVSIGDKITYTVTATNEGEYDSREVKMLVTLPDNVEVISTSQVAIEPEGRFQKVTGDLIFDAEDLQPGETRSVDITVKVVPEDDGTLSYLSDAAIYLQSETYDPNPDNSAYNSDRSVEVEVKETYILDFGPKPLFTLDRIERNESGEVIEPDPSRIEIQRDEPYTYEIAVTNTGDGTATGVVLTENIFDLAAELNEVTLTQGDYSYDPQTGEVTANFGEIAAGETETVGITITPSKAIKTSSTSTIQYNERSGTDEITTQTKIKLPPIELADLELSQDGGNLSFPDGELELFDELPADISSDTPSTSQFIPSSSELSQFTLKEPLNINSFTSDRNQASQLSEILSVADDFEIPAEQNELQILSNSESTADLSQFEETVEASGEESTLLLGVHWDNSTNPKEIPLKLLTPNGIIEEADFSNYPNIGSFTEVGDDDRKYIIVKDPEPGTWGATVSDSNQIELGEIRVYIDRFVPNVEPTLKILDISQNADGSEVTITYEAKDLDNETTFDLYYTSEQDGNFFPNAQSIASDLPEQDGVGTYTWNTEGVKPGEYYIYGIIKDQFDLPRINSNYSTQTVEITNQADLSVDLSANVAREAIVGENITYTATVTNNSDDVEDKDVNLYINIPRDFELVSTSVPATSTEGRRQEGLGDIELNLGQLAPGASQTVEIVLDPADTSEIYGRTWATVTGAAYDPNADNSQDDVFIDIVEPPVLKPFLVLDRIDRDSSGEVIEPDPSRIEIQRDEPYTYEIAVTNTGDGTATGVVLTENIFDLAAELNEVTLTQGDYSFDPQTGEVTANFGEIAAGETETVGITITPSKAIKTSSTSTIQYNERSGTDEITTQTKIKLPPIEPADLELSQTVDNPIPSLGEEINITLNLFNQGPGVAGQVEIRNSLPEGLTFVSADAGFGSYDSATGIWSAGNIANGAGTSLRITALVEDIGNFTNQAEVISTGQADPDSTPNNGDPDEDDFSSLTIRNAKIDTNEDTSVTILASELLDSYVGNNPQITEITVSTDGTAIINADGNVEFTPDPNFNGIASFEYTITDGENVDTVSTNIYVRPVNDPLIANDDIFTTDEDVSPTILASELFINDVNNDIEKELNISSVDNAVNGTASLNGEGDIQFFSIPTLMAQLVSIALLLIVQILKRHR